MSRNMKNNENYQRSRRLDQMTAKERASLWKCRKKKVEGRHEQGLNYFKIRNTGEGDK